jgi:uncharacterized coiled-coil DUF342 family protein
LKALRRLWRTPRDRHEQPDTSPPFVVERYECIRDGDFALLRISGRGRARPAALVVEGEHPEAFEPLPDPGSGDGTWRAAFALPGDLAEPGQVASLHDGVAHRVELTIPGDEPFTVPQPPAPEELAAEPAPAAEPTTPADLGEQAIANGDETRARKLVEAWSEASRLREKLNDREEELAEALKELLEARNERRPLRDRADAAERALAPTRDELERVREEARGLSRELEDARSEVARAAEAAEAERTRHTEEIAKLEAAAEKVRAELEKLKEPGSGRRIGLRRRSTDRVDESGKTQLEALEEQLAERQKRIDELERDAAKFAQRRDDALVDSLRGHVTKLEERVRQQDATSDDLRALLESERGQVARLRLEADGLKHRLASADGRAAPAPEAAEPEPEADADAAPTAATPPAQPEKRPAGKAEGDAPPWSAVDDELLARIEKAKALTN